ncbi:class I SAM-dependent methyltransferase [Bifidobacterium callitrichos]|uniref:Class I SAM-dependent methyltransferase n=2 Tax=Bifidobacterium callitrichos TaxID=762209 RepID=A0A5M9ZGK0_9BIFI|nr:class I SAM-dependent methyltransferase [Bifidobacterium callitrichos]
MKHMTINVKRERKIEVMEGAAETTFWNIYATVYDAIWRGAAGTRRIDALVVSSADAATPTVCIDLGCGTGLSAMPLRGLGWTVIGADRSEAMLKRAIHNGRLDYTIRADATAVPLPNGCARLVLLVNILQVCPEPESVIREAMRLRTNDGTIIAVWPDDTATLTDVWRDDMREGRGPLGSCAAALGRLAIGLAGFPLRMRTHTGRQIADALRSAARHEALDCDIARLGPLSDTCVIGPA